MAASIAAVVVVAAVLVVVAASVSSALEPAGALPEFLKGEQGRTDTCAGLSQ
jgi:hypothetical protein